MRKPFRLMESMRSPDRKAAALAYAEAGHPILALYCVTDGVCDCGVPACSHPVKHPMTPFFPHGFKDATTDPDKLNRIFDKHPNANIGLVPTGDVLIVDIDGSKGEASVAALNLPETLSQRTGRGRHCLFTCHGLDAWRAQKFDGVDFRYNGKGYVVVAPSRHICGKLYRWRHGPDLAAEMNLQVFKPRRSVQVDFSMSTKKVGEGDRNTHLASIAGVLRAKGTPENAIAESLAAINQEMCDPPLPQREVDKIAKSVSSYPTPSEKAFGDLAYVKVEEVRWLYRPILPRGVVTVLEGDPGIGKSNFTMASSRPSRRARAFHGLPTSRRALW